MPTGRGLDFSLHKHKVSLLHNLWQQVVHNLRGRSDGGSPIEGGEARRRWARFGKLERNLWDGILVAGLLAVWLHLCLRLDGLRDRRGNLLDGIRDGLRCRLWSVDTCVRAPIKAAQAVVWAIWE